MLSRIRRHSDGSLGSFALAPLGIIAAGVAGSRHWVREPPRGSRLRWWWSQQCLFSCGAGSGHAIRIRRFCYVHSRPLQAPHAVDQHSGRILSRPLSRSVGEDTENARIDTSTTMSPTSELLVRTDASRDPPSALPRQPACAPSGASSDTRMPLSWYVIDSHSARPTTACFVTAYVRLPVRSSGCRPSTPCAADSLRRDRACRAAPRARRRRGSSG